MSEQLEPETDTSPLHHGLLTLTGTPVPLKEINVKIQILGFVADVKSSLLYSNEEDSPVEASFTFPVHDGSAVYRFEAEIEGRHIVAEIQEREQAKLTYEDATERGFTAMLLKEDDSAGDIFQCYLGNLPPKTNAKLSFAYALELPQEPDGRIRFTLPTVLNPRYSSDDCCTVPAEGATYTSPAKIPYEFQMSANIKGYHKIVSVTSQKDVLKVETNNDDSTDVSLIEKFKFDHDLSFLVEYDNCYEPQVILEAGYPDQVTYVTGCQRLTPRGTECKHLLKDATFGLMKEELLMLNFYPRLEEKTMVSTGEYIFVVDRSGSMEGERIQNTKEALFLLLKSLPTDCYFNIISFGSEYSCLFKSGSRKYDKSSLAKAVALQKALEADMGGTNIYEPLQNALSNDCIKGHPRQVILLTDGEVYGTEQLIGLVKSHAQDTRVFTLGIGSGVSTSLIEGLARAGNGKAEFISNNDLIQSKVISLLKYATQPSMSDIGLRWELPKDVSPTLVPSQPPVCIHVGSRICLYAMLTGQHLQGSSQPCHLELTGKIDNKPVKHTVQFQLAGASIPSKEYSAPLHRLAAKAQIKVLEDELAETLSKEPPVWSGDETLTKIRQDIITVSTSANIVSKLTAFVAVDTEAKAKVEGEMLRRHCPVPFATQEFIESITNYNLSCRGCGLYDSTDQDDHSLISKLKNMASSLAVEINKQNRQTNRIILKSSVSKERCAEANKKAQNLLSNLNQRSGALTSTATQDNPSTACSKKPGLFSKIKSKFSSPKKSKPDEMVQQRTTDPSEDISSTDNKTGIKEGDQMLKMVGLQHIQGFWTLSYDIANLLNIDKEVIKSVKIHKDIDVVTTLTVVVWLRRNFITRHDEWQMIENKALSWLNNKLKEEQTVDEALKAVEQSLFIDRT